MAWTTPRTYVVGEVLSAATLNIHIRDNLNFLYGAPACRVYHNANQSLTSGVSLTLAFNSERFDNDTMHGGITQRITVNTAGRYLFIANAQFASNATGYRLLDIFHSASSSIGSERVPEVGATGPALLNAGTIWPCVAAEYVVIGAFQNSGGALNVETAASYSPEFMAHWMGN